MIQGARHKKQEGITMSWQKSKHYIAYLFISVQIYGAPSQLQRISYV